MPMNSVLEPVNKMTSSHTDRATHTPALGRGFVDADDQPGAEPVVVVSDGFWRSQLGATASALGTRLVLDGTPHTIVGVLPAGFRYVRPYALFVSMGPHTSMVYAILRHNGVSVGKRDYLGALSLRAP